jgi:hypothetical protein
MTDASDNAPTEEELPADAKEEGTVATLATAAVAAPPDEAPIAPHQGHESELTPFGYVMIALGLCVLTAMEIGLWYLEGNQTEIFGWKVFSDGWIVLYLAILAFAKFFIVAGWYMHLAGDAPIFRRYFTIGGVGALVLFLVVIRTLL